jgi:hypothetical protein
LDAPCTLRYVNALSAVLVTILVGDSGLALRHVQEHPGELAEYQVTVRFTVPARRGKATPRPERWSAARLSPRGVWMD